MATAAKQAPLVVDIETKTAATDVMLVIERVASNPDADIAKLERLIELKRTIDADHARAEFYAAFAEMQGKSPRSPRRARSRLRGKVRSRFAKNEDIQKVVKADPPEARLRAQLPQRVDARDEGAQGYRHLVAPFRAFRARRVHRRGRYLRQQERHPGARLHALLRAAIHDDRAAEHRHARGRRRAQVRAVQEARGRRTASRSSGRLEDVAAEGMARLTEVFNAGRQAAAASIC
jgi:hypothetical protein